MRIVLIIFLALSYFPYGQAQSDLRDKLIMLVNAGNIHFDIDSTGFSELPEIKYDCYNDKTGDFWHVQDLNNDGLKDLIYSGPCKPYYQCAIFLNDGTQLKNVYDSPGRLINVEINKADSKVSILKSSVGCDYYSRFTEISIGFDSHITIENTEHHIDTRVSLASELSEKVISGVLRSRPTKNDNIHQDPCSSQKNIGNQILKINKEKVVILDSNNDWQLVLYKKDSEHSVIGWIGEGF